ncbi:hypothetical protein KNT81_gp263 [Proteus phage phiP4-3]|uniref:Uncharacterized protein n=1 Tax=Proteus phage phiP4-3 TaxID=2065203 RepID=A0A2I6PFK3_9CAUD|nr:hypothetical protein KNT81_gp263 [Proteus phage phiP4-3]AUM58508.1 hypothetical protein phiP43_150 [Proteus phage phiP4-3]
MIDIFKGPEAGKDTNVIWADIRQSTFWKLRVLGNDIEKAWTSDEILDFLYTNTNYVTLYECEYNCALACNLPLDKPSNIIVKNGHIYKDTFALRFMYNDKEHVLFIDNNQARGVLKGIFGFSKNKKNFETTKYTSELEFYIEKCRRKIKGHIYEK